MGSRKAVGMGWADDSELRGVGAIQQGMRTKGSLGEAVNADLNVGGSSGVRGQVQEKKMPTILLASRSPRRREFLLAAGIEHEAEHPGVEDSNLVPGDVTPSQWVMSLAYLKAQAGATLIPGKHRLVIGADTTCVVDGRMVGTPRDAAEAREIIRGFVGRSHDVVSGVAIVDTVSGAREMFSDAASVVFGNLDEAQIEEYVATGAWAGKAGAYNLAERVAAGWPIVTSGDETTVMGLPMKKLQARLAAWQVRQVD